MKRINYSALGQAIDTTWGRSSTPKSSSFSVKVSLAGDGRLMVSYQAIVNFVTEKEMVTMKRLYSEESASIVAAALKTVKENYKDLTGDSLKLNETDVNESLEIIGFGVHNPKRTAYFRRKSIVEFA